MKKCILAILNMNHIDHLCSFAILKWVILSVCSSHFLIVFFASAILHLIWFGFQFCFVFLRGGGLYCFWYALPFPSWTKYEFWSIACCENWHFTFLQVSLRAAASTKTGLQMLGWTMHPSTNSSAPVILTMPISQNNQALISHFMHSVLKVPKCTVFPDLSVTTSLHSQTSPWHTSSLREVAVSRNSLLTRD